MALAAHLGVFVWRQMPVCSVVSLYP